MSVWMSAKEEPQKNLYFKFGSVCRAVVVDDRSRRRAERFSAAVIMSCVL